MENNQIVHKSGIRKWEPLVILSLALTIIILDTTILNVSFRTIINDLHTDIQSMQWVITAYSLMLAAFTITGGRLGDLFGRKKMFVVGAIIFAIGSFITSISQNVGTMIAGEAIIEGIGAALMLPATTSLLVSNYQGRDRQIGFGIWGGIAGFAAAIGPVVGGWLTTYYSWRWAFRINVGVAVLLVLGSLMITEIKDDKEKPTLDFVGIFLSAIGMFLMVFGFIKASTYGWIFMQTDATYFGINFQKGDVSVVIFFIIIGLMVLGLFAIWEHYMQKRGRTPLMSLALLQNSQFTLGLLVTAIMSLGQSGIAFVIPVFLQGVKHLNPLDTAITTLPMGISLIVASVSSSFISKILTPKRIIQIGLLLNIAGYFVLREGIGVMSSQWNLTPGFILFGAGFGLIISQISNMTMSAVPVHEAGEASGVNGTMRQVGATLGSAIIGAIVISLLTTNLVNGVNNSTVIPTTVKPAIAQAVSEQTSNIEFGSGANTNGSQIPLPIKNEITQISAQATVDANKSTLLVTMAFAIIALALSSFLPNSKNVERRQGAVSAH